MASARLLVRNRNDRSAMAERLSGTTAPATAMASLQEAWNERNRLLRAMNDVDELKQPDLYEELSNQWSALDDWIVETESHCPDDLRGKIAFMRWWLNGAEDDQQQALMRSIIDDVERMFLEPNLPNNGYAGPSARPLTARQEGRSAAATARCLAGFCPHISPHHSRAGPWRLERFPV
jgi:hypothetical protein